MISIADEIYSKLKGAGERKYIRLCHLKGFLSLDGEIYDRALKILELPKTKTGASFVSGHCLNFKHSIKYDYRSISKFIGVDLVIDDKSGGCYGAGYKKEYITEGNDLVIFVSNKNRVPKDLLESLINDYILNGSKNILSIFKLQSDSECVSFVSRSEKARAVELDRINRGVKNWVKDKIYINPEDSSDYYFMLNGMSFRWHTHHYNWPTCLTEQRAPNNDEAKIIKRGLRDGVFSHVFMFDEHSMAVSASCFS